MQTDLHQTSSASTGLQAGGESGGLSDEISAEVSAARFRQRRTVYDGLV